MAGIYMDYNATTPLRTQAKAEMIAAMDYIGNPSSVHYFGRQIRQKMEWARHVIANFFKILDAQVIFTSGATEANNMVLASFEGQIIISAIEHDSIYCVRKDASICPVNEQGIIQLDVLEQLLSQASSPVLLSVMLANNETGVIQPFEQIIQLARAHNAYIHCDAAQVIGKQAMDWKALTADFMTISAHKFGGPMGVGALLRRTEHPLSPLIKGGGQERTYRSGAQNMINMVGMAVALQDTVNDDWQKIGAWRDHLEASIKAFSPETIIFGKAAPRLPNTSYLTMPSVKNDTQLMNFDLTGIATSTGAACSSGKVKVSRVLRAMGVEEAHAKTAIRISLGWGNQESEVETFIAAWQKTYERCRPEKQRG